MAHTLKILGILKKTYPDAHCALDHASPFELLVATVLSAQCTDERVNKTTPELFKNYPTALAMSKARIADLELLVRPTGFYKNKAKSLKLLSEALVERHQGEVPSTMDELVALRGVGRKTANVVLGNVFGKNDGIVVDTHVGRLSRRMGWTRETDPEKVERALMAWVPQKDWTLISHLLITHGRTVCQARKPHCSECPVEKWCEKIL